MPQNTRSRRCHKDAFLTWLGDSLFIRLAATKTTLQPADLRNSVSLLHTKRKMRSDNIPISKQTGYVKWKRIYRPKPAKISTESCGCERWRLRGRYDVTNRTKFLLRLTYLHVLLPPPGHFMHYKIITI